MRFLGILVTGLGLVSASLLPACRRDAGPVRKIPLESCHLAHVPVETQCGTFEVFEDRAKASGRKLKLNIAVLPALSPRPAADPLFILAGGPGQGATKTAAALYAAFDRVRRDRDIVFVDQRGTGKSNPLKCPVNDDASLSERLGAQPDDRELSACLRSYDADASLYTTPIAMDDLDDVRAALGYEKINLWGGSYGTRAALVYVRQHEDRVRTVTLDGVAPFSLKLPLSVAKDGQRALEKLFDDCTKDASCNKAFPDLRARFDKLLGDLREKPVETTVAHPVTGEPTNVKIQEKHVTSIVRALLYVPELAALLPYTIDKATKNDFAPLVAQAWAFGAAMDIAAGMFLSVVCAEDVPFTTQQEIDEATKGTFVGDFFVKETVDACKVWPRGTVPADYRKPVHSNVPTLILSGELDPVTPPAYGEDAKRDLPNSEHRVVTGMGHGTTQAGCTGTLIADFLKSGSPHGLDPECLHSRKRPPFTVSFAGAKP